MTSLTSTNVFTISCWSIEPNHPNPPPPPRFGKFSSTARCKALQSLYCTIRRLFVLFVDYSRTIRAIRRLFADYSHYSSTIRGLFVDYSPTIRTIRFTILVLSIARRYWLLAYYIFLEYLICFWWRVNGVSFANPCDVLNTAFFTEWTLFISLLFARGFTF
jgi:hypothetical protein